MFLNAQMLLGEGSSHTLLAAKGLVESAAFEQENERLEKKKSIKAIKESLRWIMNNEIYGRWLLIEFCPFF